MLGRIRRLTTGVDGAPTNVGGSGNDVFDAGFDGINNNNATETLNNLDSLDGGTGTDTLSVYLDAATVLPASLTSIEQVDITASGASGSELNLLNAPDVQAIRSVGSTADLTVSNIQQTAATLSVSNTVQSHTFSYAPGVASGVSDAVSLTLSGMSGGTVNIAGIETINITATGTDSALTAFTALNANTLTVSGQAGLNLGNLAGSVVLRTVDASVMSGSLTVTGTNADGMTLTGGAGNDAITGNAGEDSITGNDGNDTLNGAAGADVIYGGNGLDRITGGADLDTADGGEDSDTYIYAAGEFLAGDDINDTGTVGTDTVQITTGGAILDAAFVGKSGLEAATLASAQSYTLGANAEASGITSVRMAAAGTLVAGAYTVGLTVTEDAAMGAAVITTGSGNDHITLALGDGNVGTGSGDDTVVGGLFITADDTIDGGAGTDTLTFTDSGAATSDLDNVKGFETITLGNATTAVTTLDALVAAAATLTVEGIGLSAGHTLTWNGAAEADGSFSVTGGIAADTITGGGLADTLSGGDGADSLTGNAGADSLTGGAGADTITGGAGADVADGGEGSDLYVFANTEFGVAGEVTADSGNAGTDTVQITSATAITDAMFLSVSGVEAATLASAVSYTLGANAQASGIRTVTMQAAGTLAAGAYTAGLTVTEAAGANNATITTGSGDDSVTLAGGADSVTLGSGNDTIVGGANVTDADTLVGGGGTDELQLSGVYSAGTALSVANLISGIETITVASEGDIAGANTGFQYDIAVDNGNDVDATITSDVLTVTGSGLLADADADTVGDQAETLTLNAAVVSLFRVNVTGGAAADTLTGGTLADTLVGGAGADSLTGNDGADSLTGGDGVDTIIGGAGADTIVAGADGDSIDGGSGADNITGDDGNDTITAGSGADSISGGDGADTVIVTATEFNGDNDSIDGGDGTTDVLRITSGAAVTIGDNSFTSTRISNVERLEFVGTGGVPRDFTFAADNDTQAAGITTIVLGTDAKASDVSIAGYTIGATVLGGASDDSITGSAQADSLTGGLGADTITAGAGDDSISGGAGINVIFADAGNDTVTLGADVEDVNLGTGNDTIVGGANVTDADILTGGEGSDELQLSGVYSAGTALSVANFISGIETITVASEGDIAGANTGFQYAIAVDNGNDVDAAITSDVLTVTGSGLLADADADTVGDQAETLTLNASVVSLFRVSVTGGAAADTLTGGTLADTLDGGAGADSLTGNAGADSIVGNDGGDIISGGDGADIISGDAGNDNIDAGAANDTVDAGTGNDTILGGSGADQITTGTGSDVVRFTAVNDSTGATFDTVTDFTSGTDRLAFTLSGDFDFDVSGFATVANLSDGLVSLSTARGDSFYSTADGKVYVDVNGSGTINQGLDYVLSVAALAAGDVGFEITGGASANALTGGAGADTFNVTTTANDGNDTIGGGGGADTIAVGAASTIVFAGIDANISGIESVTVGAAGSVTLTGQTEAFVITGAAGAETIVGGSGADSISAGAGADVITGGYGSDTITTGSGADDIVITGGLTADTVNDFTTGAGGDEIQLDISELETAGAVEAAITVSLDDLVDGTTAIGAGAATIQEIADQAGGGAVAAAGAGTVYVLLGETYANLAALETGLETGDHELTVHADVAQHDGFIVVWSDGTDAHVSMVRVAVDSGANFQAGDLVATDLVQLVGVGTLTASEIHADNFSFIA